MEACGERERWITVYEFRTYFHLDESSAHAISGFLRRIYEAPFFSFPYRVKKIERIIVHTPQRRSINRYLVKKRAELRKEYRNLPLMAIIPGRFHPTGVPVTGHDICTDHDAVEIFNKVLGNKPRD